jgi:hypothetical protein
MGVIDFQDPPGRNLDMLFMVDNSASMMPLQVKLMQQLPTFMNVLKNLPGGQPNLHVAVISSSLGAGFFGNVPGCSRPGGDQQGVFQHAASCAGLPATESYLSSIADPTKPPGTFINNFTGDIAAVFSCIALLGDTGCGFEHQFSSTIAALQRASTPGDPNYGFLRPDASLAIVMLTNEDDCSSPPNYSSDLFNPGTDTVANPSGLGGLQSYRCNEFGHLCNGAPPPHVPPAPGTSVALVGCTSSEGMSPGPGGSAPDPLHQLITVKSFVEFLKGLKPDPSKVLVAALAGPQAPYTVQSTTTALVSGGTDVQPSVMHSCTQNSGEYGDPGVRIKSWLDAFGSNAVFESICANDFAPALTVIANTIGKASGTNCISGQILSKADGTPNCTVVQTTPSATLTSTAMVLPLCDATRSIVPCWQFRQDVACGTAQRFDVCHEATCSPIAGLPISNINVSCSFAPYLP